MVSSRPFDLNAFVPVQAQYILTKDLHRTNYLVDKRVGQATFFFAVVKVFLDLIDSDHLRGQAIMNAQLNKGG